MLGISRHKSEVRAWDIRIISVEALLRLLAGARASGRSEDSQSDHVVLRPCEFTRLDEIVDILFSTAEDIKQEKGTRKLKARTTIRISRPSQNSRR
jgi:hypothetical protein